jgi:hypothetical protein
MVSKMIAFTFLAVLSVQMASASRAHNGFFQALSEQQKEQVSTILNGGLSKAEIREQLRHWVSSQPKETQVSANNSVLQNLYYHFMTAKQTPFQEAFQAAEKSQEEFRSKVLARHQQRLMQVSSPAKDLDTQIRAVYEDQKLTKKETCEKVQALIKSASEQLKKELKLKEVSCDD